MLSLGTLYDGGSAFVLRAGVYTADTLAGAHDSGNMALIRVAQIIAAVHGENAKCNDPFVTMLKGGLTTVINIMMALGIAVAVIGIIAGGLMRATAWGSEQRIATSNKAITAAVIGLVIVIVGVTLGNAVPGWFPDANGSCTIDSGK